MSACMADNKQCRAPSNEPSSNNLTCICGNIKATLNIKHAQNLQLNILPTLRQLPIPSASLRDSHRKRLDLYVRGRVGKPTLHNWRKQAPLLANHLSCRSMSFHLSRTAPHSAPCDRRRPVRLHPTAMAYGRPLSGSPTPAPASRPSKNRCT